MSADNYLVIMEGDDKKWRLYMEFASSPSTREELLKSKPMYEAETLREARQIAYDEEGDEYYEYGTWTIHRDDQYPPQALMDEKQEGIEAMQSLVDSLSAKNE